MHCIKGNLWDTSHNADAVCITTNGFFTSRGNAVMGRGCAKQLSDTYPNVKKQLGALLRANGNTVRLIAIIENKPIVAFPVKAYGDTANGTNVVGHAKDKYLLGSFVPGFHLKAELGLIETSCEQLVVLADICEWNKVLLPRMGCGAGELDWDKDVYPVVSKILDDRFYVITY